MSQSPQTHFKAMEQSSKEEWIVIFDQTRAFNKGLANRVLRKPKRSIYLKEQAA